MTNVVVERNSRKLIAKLEADGWRLHRVRGDHNVFKKAGHRPIVLMHPKKDLPIGLVRQIYKDVGWL